MSLGLGIGLRLGRATRGASTVAPLDPATVPGWLVLRPGPTKVLDADTGLPPAEVDVPARSIESTPAGQTWATSALGSASCPTYFGDKLVWSDARNATLTHVGTTPVLTPPYVLLAVFGLPGVVDGVGSFPIVTDGAGDGLVCFQNLDGTVTVAYQVGGEGPFSDPLLPPGGNQNKVAVLVEAIPPTGGVSFPQVRLRCFAEIAVTDSGLVAVAAAGLSPNDYGGDPTDPVEAAIFEVVLGIGGASPATVAAVRAWLGAEYAVLF